MLATVVGIPYIFCRFLMLANQQPNPEYLFYASWVPYVALWCRLYLALRAKLRAWYWKLVSNIDIHRVHNRRIASYLASFDQSTK